MQSIALHLDRPVRWALIVFGGLSLVYLLLLPEKLYSLVDGRVSEVLLLLVVNGLLVRTTLRCRHPHARQFWLLISIAFMIWLATNAVDLFFEDPTNENYHLIRDGLFILFFCFIAAAIELRLDRAKDEFWAHRYVSTAAIGALLIVALYGYFTIVEMQTSRQPYITPYGLHAALDGYFALRFLMVGLQAAQRGWRFVYLAFAAAFALIVVADIWAWLLRDRIFEYEAGNPINFIWYLWYPVAMIASSVVPEQPQRAAAGPPESSAVPSANSLIVFSLALPLFHVLGYGADMLAPVARQHRDIFVATWIIATSGLLLTVYYLMHRKLLELWATRSAAEVKARRFENQLQRELRLRSLGKLSAGLAHDFGNTLAAVALHIKAIREKESRGESTGKDFDRVASGIEFGRRIVDKLSSISAAGSRIKIETVDFSSEVSKTVDVLRRALLPGLSIDLNLDNASTDVATDRSVVHQVLTNFLYNAIDAVGSQGRIVVTARPIDANESCAACGKKVSGQFVELSVTDSGPGIPPDIADTIFEPLVSSKPVGQGSGLGLSTSSELLHAAGGHVTVRSGANSETRFSALFPL